MISCKTSVAVPVPVGHLVDLICRIYNVYGGTLMREYKDKGEYNCLMSCLPELHSTANKLLASLLFCAGQGMMRYYKLFSRILLRLLSEYDQKRPLKVSVYNLISLCLQKCGFAFAESLCKPLCDTIFNDIKAAEQLPDNIITSQNKKSGKKRRHELTHSDTLTIDQVTTKDCDLQLAALLALQNLLNSYGSSMNPMLRSSVDSNILASILQETQSPTATNEQAAIIRYKLYECLLASVMHPIEAQATILPHAVRIFSSGINDQSHQLQMLCAQGLAICDLIMHPRMPPIQSNPVQGPIVRLPGNEIDEASIHAEIPEEPVVSERKLPVTSIIKETDMMEQVIDVSEEVREVVASTPAETVEETIATSVYLSTTDANTEDHSMIASEVIAKEDQALDSHMINTIDRTESTEEVLPSPRPGHAQGQASLPSPRTAVLDKVEPSQPVSVSTTGFEDEDDDIEMPDIDLAGPDTDDDEE
ncbi:Proline-, glutamic acid- and leucine-rich protein 1 [Apophysomyces ossiformis]|uniref:Proline-, glutamic acid- and leucine-rich protein 1 n=1 Tax=Apophysomyces ossiformis TaxID=679940 RepID=A0A8H7BS73_9FUNG|nr:Proline-, glutamic acid- and leucine-rich protein 1 [Apophysomyces ossiformis]